MQIKLVGNYYQISYCGQYLCTEYTRALAEARALALLQAMKKG